MSKPFDALLLVSFGGPECHEDVIPFLENVTRGKNIPRKRLLEVASTTTTLVALVRSTSKTANSWPLWVRNWRNMVAVCRSTGATAIGIQ